MEVSVALGCGAGDELGCVFRVLRRIEVEDHVRALCMQLRQSVCQVFLRFDLRNAVESGIQRPRACLLHRSLVHAGAVVVAYLLFRDILPCPALRRLF